MITKLKRLPIEKIALHIIAGAGLIALVAVAPGMGLVLKQFGVEKRIRDQAYVSNVLSRLKRKNYIVFEGEGDGRRIRITEIGRHYLESKRLTLLYRPQKRPWDGHWRVVIFDIPERMRKMRDNLRRELAEVGFKQLQKSVWISPDECEEYLKLLKADQHIGKSLIYLKTKDIEYSSALTKLFILKR
jgi:DNA-binding transcriptional regulator PaaX